MNDLGQILQTYGADPASLLFLGGETLPGHLAFLDLFSAPSEERPDAVLRDAPGRAHVFVLDARYRTVTEGAIAMQRRLLSLRGEPAYLAILRAGRLDAYEVALSARVADQHPVLGAAADAPDAGSMLPRLLLAPDAPVADSGRIHVEIHRLMTSAIDALQSARNAVLGHTILREDSVSLVGRAVFTRFLIDRGLLCAEELAQIASPPVPPEDLFSSAESAAATCAWLDRTFNGDFLPVAFPLTAGELASRIQATGWRTLGHILHKAPDGQLALGMGDGQLDWPHLDFSRIPVGVLSQVYEQQSHHWDPAASRNESVFYTPGPIAAYMVDQVFASLEAQCAESVSALRPCDARVLDPAVGGGVFLVLAFRALVARRWTADEVRPDTAVIRGVLYDQLVGLDRQKTALRLTALSLYLAAVEMDPAPHPLERLRFEIPLIGRVLIDVGGDDAPGRAGSLGSNVGAEHRRLYDVVLGNPPWTAVRRNNEVTQEIRLTLGPIVANALGVPADQPFALPDDAPDLGFLWRVAEWCRPGGHFALVTHARLLFKQSPPGRAARKLVFGGLRVTGILNGAALRKSAVWPNVSAPFAVLFGTNERPAPDSALHFVSPAWEPTLNNRGCFRIDAESALPLSARVVRERPWLLKALFRGTRADVGVLETIFSKGMALEQYWVNELGLVLGQGFQVAVRSGQRDSSFLLNLPMLAKARSQPILPLTALPPFRRPTVCWPRKPQIYRGPLALVHKTIATTSGRPRVFVADGDLAYNELFHGFSAHGHAEGKALVRYLRFILDSPLFHWFALLTSSQYGVERDAILVEDVKRFPVPPFASLPAGLLQALRAAAVAGTDLAADDAQRKHWLSQLYGLGERDWCVIEDTLRVGAPEVRSRRLAGQPPGRTDVSAFMDELLAGLEPFGDTAVSLAPLSGPQDPWQVVAIASGSGTAPKTIPSQVLRELMSLADTQGASQLRLRLADGRVAVALLRQRRYWTRTRARLLALDLVANSAGATEHD